MLPLFNGYIQYTKLCDTKHLIEGSFVQQEFQARGILDQYIKIRTDKKRMSTLCSEALKKHERQMFDTEVNEELRRLGAIFNEGSRIQIRVDELKDKLKEENNNAEETTIDLSVYDIDKKKYMKQRSNEYNALSLLI